MGPSTQIKRAPRLGKCWQRGPNFMGQWAPQIKMGPQTGLISKGSKLSETMGPNVKMDPQTELISKQSQTLRDHFPHTGLNVLANTKNARF